MNNFLQDVRYAVRILMKSPGFTVIAVLTLALGIGANTAIFSVVNAVLLRPLPYPQPEQVVTLGVEWPGGMGDTIESQQYVYWRDHSEALESVAAMFGSFGGFNLVGNSGPVHVRGSKVTHQFFGATGIRPMLGRGFSAEEDLPGGPQVVVISYGLWRSAFGSDAGVVGRSMPLNGTSYSIVGVLPPGFRFEAGDPSISNPDVLIPLQLSSAPADRGTNYMLIARMKPGASLSSAQSDTDRVADEFTRAYPNFFSGYSAKFSAIRVLPFQKSITGDVQRPLLILLAAVVFVLLIACVNVANLFLSRATARHREMAIRAALGASGRRLFGQLLSESVVFAALAGVAGFALGAWGVRLLVALSPVDLPRIGELSVDWRVLAFTCALSLIVALACGGLAAFHAGRSDVSGSLKDRSQASAPARRVSQMLVVGEIALSLMLLSGAALLIATMIHLYRVPMGFDASNVTSLRMSLFSDKYRRTAEVARFEQQVREQVSRLPGVVSASTASATPLERGLNLVVYRNGVASGEPNNQLLIEYRSISPGYFRTMAIPLLNGREFNETDSANSTPVALINETLARELWPHESPLGKLVRVSEGSGSGVPRQMVGVVADIKEIGLDTPARATVYVPEEQVPDSTTAMTNYWFASSLLVKTAQPLHLENDLRRIVNSIDPQEPISSIDSMADVKSRSVAEQRFFMVLMGSFAALALLLAAVGIYGVLSYQVVQRTREIGIRMALGATRSGVLRHVLGEGLRVIVAGVVIGLAGSLAATTLLSDLLFGVKPGDPASLASVVVILVVAALAACYIPARRATLVDPIIALRHE